MISITFKISEVDGNIQIVAGGGNIGRPSKMEQDFTKKLLTHVNRFNTSYKNLHRKNCIRMREVTK